MVFNFKKKESGKFNLIDLDEILGYCDELISKKVEITLSCNNKNYLCNLYSFEPGNKIIRIQNIQPLFSQNGKKISCGFPMDRAWFTFQTKLVVSKDNLFINTPEEIIYSERRKSRRGVFSPREEVKVTVVESIGSGTGVFGTATNISAEGISLTIDKAMLLNNEKVISPHPDLYKPNTEIMLIKINKIPGGRPFETSGKVKRVFKDRGKWKLAIEFGKLPGNGKSQIQSFVSSRTSEFKLTKRSRKKRKEIEESRKLTQPISKPKPIINNKQTPPNPLTKPIQPKTEPKIEQPKLKEKLNSKITVVSLGEELKTHLSFLSAIPSINWAHAENQIQILALIHEVNANVLILPFLLGDHNMLDYLQKIQTMGLIDKIKTAICSPEQITIKDKIKGKRVNVETFFSLPIIDKVEFINYILDTNITN